MIYYLVFPGHGLTNKQQEQTSVIQFGVIHISFLYYLRK